MPWMERNPCLLLPSAFVELYFEWDVDSRDWQKREAADMVTDVSQKVRPGSILLFHNDTPNTPAALRQLIPMLKGEGYEFVLVKDLVFTEGYRLDHEGRQVREETPQTSSSSDAAE